jgi:penicillin-binding protein 1C
MQLARMLYGLDTRSVPGKLEQIALAIGLELHYSKRDILEAHVNLMPYGGNVQGVGTASLVYFGKTPSQLALGQPLALVLVPQSPAARSRSGQAEPASLTAARRDCLNFGHRGKGSQQLVAAGLPRRSGQPAVEAPHLTRRCSRARQTRRSSVRPWICATRRGRAHPPRVRS